MTQAKDNFTNIVHPSLADGQNLEIPNQTFWSYKDRGKMIELS